MLNMGFLKLISVFCFKNKKFNKTIYNQKLYEKPFKLLESFER